MTKAAVVTLHIFRVPRARTVTVMVTERGQPGGEFIVSAAAMARVRRCLTPGAGFRIRDYPP